MVNRGPLRPTEKGDQKHHHRNRLEAISVVRKSKFVHTTGRKGPWLTKFNASGVAYHTEINHNTSPPALHIISKKTITKPKFNVSGVEFHFGKKMSKTKLLTHIVFTTKYHKRSLPHANMKEIYSYIWGIIKNNKCFLHRIGGMSDHIHLLVDMHPTVCVAELVKDLKQSSNRWMTDEFRRCRKFDVFEGWARGYYAVSVSPQDFDGCRNYITNQIEHHSKKALIDELKDIARVNGLEWFDDDWT